MKEGQIMKKSKKMLLTGFVFLFVFCCFYLTARAKEKNEFVMGVPNDPFIPFTSFGGKGTADAREMFQTALDEFTKLHGYTITLKFYPAPKFLYKAIQSQEVDFAVLAPPHYLYAKQKGLPLKPFLFVTLGNEKVKQCIWVHKDSHIQNIKQLQGKSFAAPFPGFNSKNDLLPPEESHLWWIITKKILFKNGVNKPFKDFFKEFKVLPVPWESLAYVVLLKKFDALTLDKGLLESLKNYDQQFSELKPLDCVHVPTVAAGTFYRHGVNPAVVKSLKEYMLSPKKDSALEKMIKKEGKGMFKPVLLEEKDFAVYFQWLKEAKQKGWIDEFNEIMKNTPLPKKKGRVK